MAQQDRLTKQLFVEGDKFKADGNTFECVHVSYQERTKEGTVTEENPGGEVERYNYTYSFRPFSDMENERAETEVPQTADGKSAEELQAERDDPGNQPVPNEGQGAY